jgi:hypothetical protein
MEKLKTKLNISKSVDFFKGIVTNTKEIINNII